MAALCVLDVLTAEEAAPVHAHLAACGRPHTDIQRAAESAGALALSVDPVLPPVELRDRVMTAVTATPQVPDRLVEAPVIPVVPEIPIVPATPAAPVAPGSPGSPVVVPFDRPSRRPRDARVAWVGLAAAAVVALLLGGWGLSLQRQLSDSDQQFALVRQAIAAASDPSSSVATLTATDAAPGASGMVVLPASGTGYLMVQGLPALEGGQVYQAWYLAGGVPTSAGLMDPPASGITVMGGLEPIAGTDTIALTVEPAGGVPQPTGEVVVAGTLPA
jgi:hypothetical protein